LKCTEKGAIVENDYQSYKQRIERLSAALLDNPSKEDLEAASLELRKLANTGRPSGSMAKNPGSSEMRAIFVLDLMQNGLSLERAVKKVSMQWNGLPTNTIYKDLTRYYERLDKKILKIQNEIAVLQNRPKPDAKLILSRAIRKALDGLPNSDEIK